MSWGLRLLITLTPHPPLFLTIINSCNVNFKYKPFIVFSAQILRGSISRYSTNVFEGSIYIAFRKASPVLSLWCWDPVSSYQMLLGDFPPLLPFGNSAVDIGYARAVLSFLHSQVQQLDNAEQCRCKGRWVRVALVSLACCFLNSVKMEFLSLAHPGTG